MGKLMAERTVAAAGIEDVRFGGLRTLVSNKNKLDKVQEVFLDWADTTTGSKHVGPFAKGRTASDEKLVRSSSSTPAQVTPTAPASLSRIPSSTPACPGSPSYPSSTPACPGSAISRE